MLKRFYSKRSGFTLVEIIVAFAVFAVMAAMIVQMLDLTAKMRLSNNAYQRELAEQECLLTLINKKQSDFDTKAGDFTFNFTDGTSVVLPYAMLSAKADAEFIEEGLNYFVAPVNYQSDGVIPPTSTGGNDGATNTGSQASRMDTRITGTGGIKEVEVLYVIKDTNTYPADSPYYLPAGKTRYFIRCAADAETMDDEVVGYSQYRLYFYHEPDPANPSDKSYLDGAQSSVTYKDSSGKEYTKDVPKAATITNVGYLNNYANVVAQDGLKSSYIANDVNSYNDYTITWTGSNSVRIGSPFVSIWGQGGKIGYSWRGKRFSNYSNFYIEFDGDPHLTTASFGEATRTESTEVVLHHKYTAVPIYLDAYNDDGTPRYLRDSTKMNVNIYGASLFKRNYGGGT